MLALALRTLRFRKGTFVAAFIAMLLGASLVMACGGLMETGIRADVPPQRLAGADIVVAGDQHYDVPDADETAVLPERVRVDAELAHTIAGIPGVRDSTAHVFDGEPPPGTTDAIGVVPEPGTDVAELRNRIDTVLDGTDAVTLVGDDRGLAELPEAATTSTDLIALAGVFGGWAVMASMFGVASMLALSVRQRHRELALLRAVGTTPRQVRRMVLGETLVLVVIATGLAYFPGQFLGRLVFDRMADAGVVTAGLEFNQGWIPTVAAVGASMIAAIGGALVAGRRAAATRPTQALAEASAARDRISGWRVFFAVLFIGGGVALSVVTLTVMSGALTASTAGPAVIVWAIGLALLSPALTRVMIAVLQWPVRALAGLSGHLAVLNARAGATRTAAAVAPIVMLTGIAAGTLYLQTTEQATVQREFTDSFVADAVVTSKDGIDTGLIERIGAMPEAAGASAYVRSTGFIEHPKNSAQDDEGQVLQGVTAQGAAATAPVTITDGALTDLEGDSVAVKADRAEKLGVGLSDTITLRLGDRSRAEVTVVAIFTADETFDALLLPADVLAPHTTEGRAHEILVTAGDGTDPTQLVHRLNELVSDHDGLAVADRETVFDRHDEQSQTMAFANYTIVMVIVAYAAVSVVNTLASSTNSRRRELGLQRLTGSTRAETLRMLGVEGLLVAAVGVALGTIASIATVVPFSLSRADSLVPSGSPLIYLTIVAAALVLTLAATIVPGLRTTRGRAAEAAVAVE